MLIRPLGQKKNGGFISGKSKPASSQSYTPRVPHWWKKENTGLKSVAICPRCQAIYYDKHWHSWQKPSRHLPKDLRASETYCLACAAIISGNDNSGRGFAGEVVFSGLDRLAERLEVVNLIKNIGKRALKRNPEDQIVKIEDKNNALRVTTVKNQLAVSLGKQVDAALKGGKLTISWSREDEPARVRWVAP